MNLYEVMYIINPDIEGEELEEAIARVSEVMEKEGSEVEQVKKIGKRRLAYEINDIKDGYYVLVNVRAEPKIVPALEHFFRVTDGYLRYMVVRLDDEKQTAVKEVVEETKENNNEIEKTAVVDE